MWGVDNVWREAALGRKSFEAKGAELGTKVARAGVYEWYVFRHGWDMQVPTG